MDIGYWQWGVLGGFLILMLVLSPKARDTKTYYQASSNTGKKPGLWLLTSSLVISWIFAKSITNAANLGLSYGIMGGLAYGTYYLSFLFAGVVIFRMRTIGGYRSIHEFLRIKFGKSAVVLFSLLIGFRLLNEVWSNTMVIGSYFGSIGSSSYYLAILVFTILTLMYSLRGGLRSSMFTDLIQMILFGFLLLLLLSQIVPQIDVKEAFQKDTQWSMAGGLDLALVALVQVFSYPFHDPVLTDRGFISDEKLTLKAFALATVIGFMSIVLFSLIGVYAKQAGLMGEAAVQVSQSLSVVAMLAMNFIMITSASSTLDSAFASFSKLINVDLGILTFSITSGRLIMATMAIVGTIPIFFSPAILSATTVSGTMVIGLAPIFLFWKSSVSRYSFLATVGTGALFGIGYAAGYYPEGLVLWDTPYGELLSVNVLGSISCFVVYFMIRLVHGRS
ncbi:MAG: sodium:solute symporter [Cyclobacteriaceae bacterium]